MISLELTDVKNFMNQLLKSDTFDHFLLQEAVISNGATYNINGQITKGYYDEVELDTLHLSNLRFFPFSLLKSTCFDLIKGKKTPSFFRFVFLLSPENQSRTIASMNSSFQEQDISGIFINLRYQNQLLSLTTGISYNIFSTDKSLESEWDKLVTKFLIQHDISFQELS